MSLRWMLPTHLRYSVTLLKLVLVSCFVTSSKVSQFGRCWRTACLFGCFDLSCFSSTCLVSLALLRKRLHHCSLLPPSTFLFGSFGFGFDLSRRNDCKSECQLGEITHKHTYAHSIRSHAHT